jgi:hypothetical protein
MSRGLGKLQRELLALVAEDWFFGEYVLLGQPVEPAPWLTWRIIRNRYFQKHGFGFQRDRPPICPCKPRTKFETSVKEPR